MFDKSSNPVFRAGALTQGSEQTLEERMSVAGTVNKTALLLGFAVVAAGASWYVYLTNPQSLLLLAFGGAIGGLVLGLVTSFMPRVAPYTSVPYALCEGLFLGALSAILSNKWPGIAIQAATLTFGTMGVMLVAYRTGVIRATEKFKACVVSAIGAIALFYLAVIIMRLFSVDVSFMTGNSLLSIGISVVIVIVASLSLILDFDFIHSAVESGAPKSMEWYAAFGLLVTLVWLYVEFIRLLSKLRER